MLHKDIDRVILKCKKTFAFFEKLDDERQYALIDMVFQMGAAGVGNFKKMLSALAVGNYKTAAAECLANSYARQTPVRAQRIAKLIEQESLYCDKIGRKSGRFGRFMRGLFPSWKKSSKNTNC